MPLKSRKNLPMDSIQGRRTIRGDAVHSYTAIGWTGVPTLGRFGSTRRVLLVMEVHHKSSALVYIEVRIINRSMSSFIHREVSIE